MAKRSYSKLLLNGVFVQVVSSIHDSLYCSLCSNVLNNPQQTLCGCRFCLECITEYLSTGSKMCPGVTSECMDINLQDLRSDSVAKRDVNKLMIKCPSEQCRAEFMLSEKEEHSKSCNKNVEESKYVSCKYCGVTLEKVVMNSVHRNFNHVDVCNKYYDFCPNNCGEINKVLWKDHADVCDANKSPCLYEKLGCEFKLRKKEMSTHLVENSYKHTEILLKHIDNLNNEITSLKAEKNILCKKESSTENESNFQYKHMLQDVEDLKLEMVNVKSKMSDDIGSIKRMVQSHNPNDLNVMKSKINEIEETLIFYNGRFLWRLTDFYENNYRRMYSNPFYTNDSGYLMQLELTRSEEPGFLSIYVKLMRGNFDDELDWPFTQKVTIRILDHDRRNRNYVQSLDFQDAPNVYCNRPRKRYGKAYGILEFISLNELNNKPYLYCNSEIWIDCFIDDTE